MNIVILTQYYLPEMGAPQGRLSELATELQKLDWEVSVVTAMPNYPTGKIFDGYRGSISQDDKVNGVPVKRFWMLASNSHKAFPRIVSMLSFSTMALFSVFFIRGRRPDYLFVESPPLPLAFSGWILSRMSGARLIMNVSDLWPLSARELGALGDGLTYRFLQRAERFIYRRSSICTGQSQQIVDHIQRIKGTRVHLFRNGVDTSRFGTNGYDPAKRKFIVYAGLLGAAQGILLICKNIDFRSLGTEFHIYGAGMEEEEIRRFAIEYPEKGIVFWGVVERGKMPELLASYGGALIALVRNIYGAVPSKIYEAMAAGLQILFSGDGEGAEIIRHHAAGWVNQPRDWEKLRQNIREFVRQDEGDFLRGRNGNRQVAITHFDRKDQIKQLSQTIRALS